MVDTSVGQLLTGPVFSDSAADQVLFENAMNEELRRHHKESIHYRKFLQAHGWAGEYEIGRLPPLPVSAFKHSPLLTQLSGAEGFTLKSSGTSGAASQIFVDRTTSARQKKSLSLVMQEFLGDRRWRTLVFDVDPRDSVNLGARQAAILGYTRQSSSTVYLMESSSTGPAMKENWRELVVATAGDPILVVGFTFVVFEALQAILRNAPVILPTGSKLIHIGGWKKLQDRAVSRDSFKLMVKDSLGIPTGNTHDVYGFTELMGVSFVECEFGWKHVPKWVRARASLQGSLAEGGQSEGLLTFECPLAHSYLGLSIVTDDIGVVDSRTSRCGCGRPGQRLQVRGRRSRAEIRGCGDILGSLYRQEIGRPPGNMEVTILFPQPSTGNIFDLRSAIEKSAQSQLSLGLLNHADVLQVIELLRARWKTIEGSDPSGNLRRNGLGFLIEWANPDRIRDLLDSSIAEGRESLDRWVPRSFGSSDKVRNLPVGMVSQWVSGNVPVLGIFPIILSWLAGNPTVSRLSSTGSDLTLALLEPLLKIAEVNPVAKTLVDATVLCSFPRENIQAHTEMSMHAKMVVSWGGLEAIRAISSLPTEPETRSYHFGPRTSYAVVFESMLDNERKIASVARRLVADASVFEQAACASPHSVFIVGSNPTSGRKLAEALADAFQNWSKSQPHLELDPNLTSEIALYRSRKALDSEVYSINDEATIVLGPASGVLPEPVFGRTLHLQQVERLEHLQHFVTPLVQSVGLLGLDSEVTAVANLLGPLGVKRFPSIGRMTNFENPWDGVNLVAAMLRPATLGGPR